MSLGDPRWQPWVLPEESALPLLKAAYDRGITTWDTANVYSNGRSEEILAAAIKKYNLPRHKIVIMTKICGTVREDNDPDTLALEGVDDLPDYVNQRGLSRAGIFNAVEKCLERLQTGYIDLLQIHRFDRNTPVEETMRALHDLVVMGKVRYLGASSMWAVQFAEMQWVAERNGWTKFVRCVFSLFVVLISKRNPTPHRQPSLFGKRKKQQATANPPHPPPFLTPHGTRSHHCHHR
jgi:aryl-alcohol dehydrogenase-like predicted oxidoreductase